MNERNLPVALTGDFNSGPEDAPVQEITAVLRDARTLSPVVFGPADTWNGFQFQEKPKGCIDHIFVSHHGWKVERFATLTDSYELKYPSDHFPVLATLHLSESR
jgi:endonuclease/exonuclease/phosphatase family metal-dependent hydrolase